MYENEDGEMESKALKFVDGDTELFIALLQNEEAEE
jgi:hypothetical protein